MMNLEWRILNDEGIGCLATNVSILMSIELRVVIFELVVRNQERGTNNEQRI
jgi:hypothetical protein